MTMEQEKILNVAKCKIKPKKQKLAIHDGLWSASYLRRVIQKHTPMATFQIWG